MTDRNKIPPEQTANANSNTGAEDFPPPAPPVSLRERGKRNGHPAQGIFSPADIPLKKRSNYRLAVNREKLFFRDLTVESGKKLSDAALLAVQGHFIPFRGEHVNMIYSMEKGRSRKFFSWIGPEFTAPEGFFYDEAPESLFFHCDPALLKTHVFFVFRRVSGYEVIYLAGTDFCSVFAPEAANCSDAVVVLARKYALRGTALVFSDVELDLPDLEPEACPDEDRRDVVRFQVSRSDGAPQRAFFLPDVLPMSKRYSNISRVRQSQGLADTMRRWERLADLLVILLILVLLSAAAGHFYLRKDTREFGDSYQVIRKMADRCDLMEFSMEKIRRLAASYPDHMRPLQALAEAVDIDSVLLRLSLGEEGMIMEGYSPNSLEILNRLNKSGVFKEVRFKSSVIKNVSSNREKFEIEMLLPNGVRK